MIVVQLLINGIIAGSIYALVAVGFSLIYATNRFIHFAHGGFVTVSAYLIYLFDIEKKSHILFLELFIRRVII